MLLEARSLCLDVRAALNILALRLKSERSQQPAGVATTVRCLTGEATDEPNVWLTLKRQARDDQSGFLVRDVPILHH